MPTRPLSSLPPDEDLLVTEAAHDAHFLSRLARVSTPDVELALALYRDVPLLRYLIEAARVPEGAERIALSLGDPVHGPFVIVTREGRFVTCLGEGMTTALPVITRGRLDTLCDEGRELRERLALARELSARAGGVNRLVARVLEAGQTLTRDEFRGISTLQPLLRRELPRTMLGLGDVIKGIRVALRGLRRVRRAADVTLLRNAWNAVWAVGHLQLLSVLDVREILEDLPPDLDNFKGMLSWGAVRQGMMGVALRGAWAVGRLGKICLGPYKDNFSRAQSPLQLLDKGMGLMAIAARHTRYRAEVAKALARYPDNVATYPEEVVRPISDLMRVMINSDATADAIATTGRRLGGLIYAAISKGRPEAGAHRILDADEVPEDLALASIMGMPHTFVGNMEMMGQMLLVLPYIARAEPESFYFPAELIEPIVGSPTPEEMLKWVIDPLREHYGPAKPVRAAPATGRNEACPCGSGKKYKRCCGAGK